VVEESFMTLSLGYKLSSEEQSPADLVRHAQMAEDAHAAPATPGTKSLHRVCRRSVRLFHSDELEAVLYPNALMLRASPDVAARAHARRAEACTGQPDMFQTAPRDGQEIERQTQRVWSAYRLNPPAHENARPLLSRHDEIAAEIARRPLSFDDWQVVYRELLQLGRALEGHSQILDVTLPKERFMASLTPPVPTDPATQSLSTRQLLGQLLETVSLLVTKEVELARAELRADVKAELGMVKL